MTHQDVAGVIASEDALADFIYGAQNYADAKERAKQLFVFLESQAKALSEATEAVFIEHDCAVAWQANARSLESSLAEARRVIEQCRDALSRCYDVVDWPADGSTSQDEALTAARDFINAKEKT